MALLNRYCRSLVLWLGIGGRLKPVAPWSNGGVRALSLTAPPPLGALTGSLGLAALSRRRLALFRGLRLPLGRLPEGFIINVKDLERARVFLML